MESSMESKPRVCFEFQIEKIIDISNDGNYQVQWAPAWVSKFHLVGCEHLIEEFLQQQAETQVEYELEENDLESQNHVTSDRHGYLSERNVTLAQPGLSDQSSVQNSTIKIEEAVEMNNLDTHVFTPSVSQSIPTDSAATTLIDTSASTNTIIVYNSADSNISSISTGDRVTHLSQYQESVSEREIKQDHEETVACSQVNTNVCDGQVESLPVPSDRPDVTVIVGEMNLMNKATCTGVNYHHNQHYNPNIQEDLTDWNMSRSVAPFLSGEEQQEQVATTFEIKDDTAVNFSEILIVSEDEGSVDIDLSETRVGFSSTSADEVDEFHNVSQSIHLEGDGIYQTNSSTINTNRKYHEELANHHWLKERKKPRSDQRQCPYCTKQFNRYELLTAHICIHTGEKPFKCDVCGKGFRRKSVLRKHQHSHTGNEPNSCPHCTYSSYSKGNLVKHMQKHTGEKHFICSVCGKLLTDFHSLKVHERTHNNFN